jgi:hypothetical protein
MGKTKVTLDDLKSLHLMCQRVGTQPAFCTLALEWAEEAVKEVDRLRGLVAKLEAAVKRAYDFDWKSGSGAAEVYADLLDALAEANPNGTPPYCREVSHK